MKKTSFCLLLIFIIIVGRIFYLSIIRNDYYKEILDNKTNIEVLGLSAPRGRILDINGNVLVDNIGINSIVYNKSNLTIDEEIEVAYTLAKNISSIKGGSNFELKKLWLAKNNNGENLIKTNEYQLYDERKLNNYDLNKLKYERVTDELLNKFNELDKKAATVFTLMNKGYSYDKKIISKDVTEKEFANILEMNIKGITGELSWERKYNYGDTLKNVFGNIGLINEETKDYYLKMIMNLRI